MPIRIEYSATFHNQPPSEIRTGRDLPAFSVRLQLNGSHITGTPSPIEARGSVNAISHIVYPDGHRIVAADIESSRPETATAPEHHHTIQDGELNFSLRFWMVIGHPKSSKMQFAGHNLVILTPT